jgi:hypothetical protein
MAVAGAGDAEGSKRLILYGFFKDSFKKDYPDWNAKKPDGSPKYLPEQKKAMLDKLKPEQLEKYADHDELEVEREQLMLLNYPKPHHKYFMSYEVPHESIEPIYYWSLAHLQVDWGFPIIHKITDLFTASEHSSFYGAAAQRLGLAQDKVSQYMATIGKMIKDMFQLVRELRWIDERKRYYEDSEKGNEGAEIALKGLWTDMVDGVVGGQRTSSNLFVMAQQLQFAALPDLFFSVHATKPIVAKLKSKSVKDVTSQEVRDMVDKIVDKQAEGFNKEVKNILKRKLYQYLVWKDETWLEIQQRRTFTLRYLWQHYQSIKMYITWVKPYLKHIQKLGADVSKLSSPELIAAFEGSLIEIEILGQKIPEGNRNVYTCIMLTFNYRTRPQMAFSQEGGFHRGPLHQGKTEINWRAYNWTQEQIDNYIKMKDAEDFELISSIDSSLTTAMDALGTDLKNYLEEARASGEEKKPTGEKVPPPLPSIAEPFKEVGKGFAELFGAFTPKKKSASPAAKSMASASEIKSAAGFGKLVLWQHYKNFKKAHRLLTW